MILAGEASGDLHGAGVVRALRERAPGIEVFGMGGDQMRAEGMDVLVDIRHMAFMGFVEVVRNLGTVFDAERVLGRALDERRPEAVLLIDYPGFNLRFARRARKAGVAVFYYISPQVWAWHKSRIHTIRELVDRMHVIFPFEETLYREAGVPVTFVGHPLVERLAPIPDRAAWLRVAMAVCVVPVALFCNCVRVIITGAFQMYGMGDLATGTPHALLGLGMFALGIGIYMGLLWVFEHLFEPVEGDAAGSAT